MLRCIVSAFILLFITAQSLATFSIFQVAAVDTAPDVTCNFITGVATGTGSGTCVSSLPTCDGVADDTTAFNAFVTWAISTWQASHAGLIQLDIDAGKNCQLNSPGTVTFDGIRKLRIVGYGASLGGNYFHLGGSGQYQDNLHSTRIAAVSAGATTVAFAPASATQPAACNSNATCAAVFIVGKYALIAGYDLQSGVGFPSNPFYFQYLKITNVNSTTGVVTFDRTITDSYKTTWPNYSAGSAFEVDDGGPATLYALKPGWDIEIEWRGVTFTSTNQIDAAGKSAIFRNVTFTATGNVCLFPTSNSFFSIINGTMLNCTMESDKIVETMVLTNVVIDQIAFQNSGIKQFTATGLTVRNVIGTPLAATITNSNISETLFPGPNTNGRANSLSVANSVVAAVGIQSTGAIGGIYYKGSVDEGINNISGLSMSGGVITIPNTYITGHTEAIGWSAPGTNMCWADATYLCARVFQIVDVTKDATNTYIQTNESGGFPAWSYSGGKLFIRTHPAPQVTFTNVTGSSGEAASLSLAPAGAPLYSYYKHTLVNADTATNPLWSMFGNIYKYNVTVNSAYAGAIAAIVNPKPLSGVFLTSAYATSTYSPIINVKSASPGLRALDASGGSYPVSWSGSQSGDTLSNLTQALWSPNLFQPNSTNLSSDPGNQFSVTIEFITSQGLLIP